ncbi:unnamed protein product [Ectocarpus sp. 12 AP-2014]
MRDVAPQASPVFPKPVYSRAVVSNEPDVGSLLVSQTSARQFFCPAKDSRFIQTQFGGAVQTVFEATPFEPKEEDQDERSVIIFGGKLLRYCPSCPLALKTNRISVLKLEAQWQRCAMGELVGEDPVKEIASLQLLQGGDESAALAAGAAGGGHHGVEELIEALADDTTLYKISPWYSGGELFDLAPMSEDVAKPIFSQILDAVTFVHSKGVCHRDISLENILMDTSSVSKRACARRSCSVSSIGSSITISSDDTEHEDRYEEAGGGGGRGSSCPGSCSPRSYFPPCSPQGGSCTAERRKTTDIEGEWLGTPRLCDFGMSVRIPTSPATGNRAPLTPQGRCGKSTCVAPEVFYDQAFDGHAIDTWSVGTTLFMALLGVQPWEEVGDFKFQAIAEGKNLDVVLQGWKLRDAISDEAVDLLQAMLTADPEERLSDIKSILSHPWFHRSTSTGTSSRT